MAIRFYPDTNVIHELCSAWTPSQFDLKARNSGAILCLGHQTYELARSFLYDHSQEAVRTAFVFLSEIECIEYLPSVNQSIEAEAYLAKAGMPLVTVVGPLNQIATRQELLKLAKGYSDDAREFISKREKNIAIDKMEVAKLNQSAVAKAKALDLKRTKQIKTYELLQKELKPGRPGWLKMFLQKKGFPLTLPAIHHILDNPTEYPLINTIVNSQEYLYFITAFHGMPPGKDTLDDFRHLVESSLTDIFVTRDGDLLSQALKIRPFRTSLSWQDFKFKLEPL